MKHFVQKKSFNYNVRCGFFMPLLTRKGRSRIVYELCFLWIMYVESFGDSISLKLTRKSRPDLSYRMFFVFMLYTSIIMLSLSARWLYHTGPALIYSYFNLSRWFTPLMTKLIPVSILEAIAVLLSNRRTHPLNCPSHNPEILKKETKEKKRKYEGWNV